jgi:hypothetical protein
MSLQTELRDRLDASSRRVRLGVLSLVLGAAIIAPAAVLAEHNRNSIAAPLDGASEVPVRDTRAHGVAKFQLSKDGTSVSYQLNVANIQNVTQAHIHVGPRNDTGPVVAWLYPMAGPPAAPAGAGRFNGVLAQGTLTGASLVGPLVGQPLGALLAEIHAGNAYVNVHTDDGIAPPSSGPGDFPGGEIRNQIRNEGR